MFFYNANLTTFIIKNEKNIYLLEKKERKFKQDREITRFFFNLSVIESNRFINILFIVPENSTWASKNGCIRIQFFYFFKLVKFYTLFSPGFEKKISFFHSVSFYMIYEFESKLLEDEGKKKEFLFSYFLFCSWY